MSTLKIGPAGYWERDGEMFPYIAKIKTDKCLKSEEIRRNFHPNQLVKYELDKISKEDFNDDEPMYFASVVKFENKDLQVYPIPLCMLDFSEKQKKEIMKVKHFPRKAFEKSSAIIKNESSFDDNLIINEVGFEDIFSDNSRYYAIEDLSF
ncbi:MAG: hypothetical protein ACOYL8_02925 [Patescibacteria group bacterium]